MRISEDRLNAIAACAQQATPGPWRLGRDDSYHTVETLEGGLVSESIENARDATFIANSRQDVVDMLTEIRHAHDLIAKLWRVAEPTDHAVHDAIRQANYGGMIFARTDRGTSESATERTEAPDQVS
jgi:hypothetical protein